MKMVTGIGTACAQSPVLAVVFGVQIQGINNLLAMAAPIQTGSTHYALALNPHQEFLLYMAPLSQQIYGIWVEYWPHITLVLSLVISIPTAIHAAMNKTEVRAAIGWVGVILLSPYAGSILYLIAGINRVRQTQLTSLRDSHIKEYIRYNASPITELSDEFGPQFQSLKTLGDDISRFQLRGGNHVQLLKGGDQTYPAMLEAINTATHSIALQSYIFDNDRLGTQFVEALEQAQQRGVQIRVLIDAIGVQYSRHPIHRVLRKKSIPCALFMSIPLLPLSFLKRPYANLRSHRKVLIVDGLVAFTGGMNIREGFYSEYTPEPALDTHFKLQGPIAAQLISAFVHDWEFTTKEELNYEFWRQDSCDAPLPHVPARCIRSGPDSFIASTHSMLLGAFAIAQQHIRIQSPYFLPDQVLLGAINTAARRGVRVDIVIPKKNNLQLVSRAMLAQIDQVISAGAHVWLATGSFNHSKLLTIDGQWSYVGSSNLDPRSLRLNFELDVEIYCLDTAQKIQDAIDFEIQHADALTLKQLKQIPFKQRLLNRLIWLASPYL